MLGTFLNHARALYGTMLLAMNEISSQQDATKANTMKKSKRFLDYTASYPDAYIRYYEGNMTLHIESEASYLVLSKKSRISGYLFLKKKWTHSMYLFTLSVKN